MSELIEIVVDDMPVPVDSAEYADDPKAVIETVRAERRRIREAQEQFEPAPDYDALTAEWGEQA